MPKKEPAAPAMPGGGMMGGMDYQSINSSAQKKRPGKLRAFLFFVAQNVRAIEQILLFTTPLATSPQCCQPPPYRARTRRARSNTNRK